VTDRSRATEPWFILTGDTLFSGGVGRPDLLAAARSAGSRSSCTTACTVGSCRFPTIWRCFRAFRRRRVRQGAERKARVDDRIRAALQSRAAARQARRLRAVRPERLAAAAATVRRESTPQPRPDDVTTRLGLRENLPQFALLVGLNAFVGAMVGLERTVLPLLGEQEFGLTSKTAITSFIVSFGVTKALLNLVAARLSDRVGRKPILVIGWLFALPVPFLIIFAPAWWWIDLANVLLGANQAMAWSMTVIMKVDLVGPRRRGLALGLNEFAGYVAVGLMSWITGFIAGHWGLRPYPFYLGIGIAVVGLLVSVLAVRETAATSRSNRALCRRRLRAKRRGSPHLLRHESRQRQPVRRLSGRPGQQPERWDVVGPVPAVSSRRTDFRSSRSAS